MKLILLWIDRMYKLNLIARLRDMWGAAPMVALLLLGVQAAYAQDSAIYIEAASQPIHVTGSWVKPARAGAESVTAYMTIHNDSDEQLVLQSIESADFKSVKVHEMGEVDGMLAMKTVENLEIPPQAAVALKPGGKHIMMMEPLREIERGDTLELVFQFVSGVSQAIEFRIEE